MSAGLAILGAMAEADVAAPQLSPAAADSPVALDVSVSCATAGAEIHYTLNGAEPTRFDPRVTSGSTVRVSRNATVKAKAWLAAESSATVTEDYRITGAVVSGDQHGLALSVSGRVWSWGNQNHGKLGNGLSTNDQVLNPIQVLHGAGHFETGAALAAGFTHSLVQDQSGAVWSFGRNDAGQLGNNEATDRSSPVQVKLSASPLTFLADSRAIAAGQDWSMALRADGSLLSWGSQATGRLGSGSTSGSRLMPGAVKRGDDGSYPALAGIRGIAAAPAFGLAREAHALETPGGTGEVWAWGYNNTGQLGLGHTTNSTRAMPVKRDADNLLTDVLDLSAGEAHSVFLRWHATDPALQGSVWTAGNRAYGRLGNGSTAAGSVTFPTPVLKVGGAPLDHIEQIAAGAAHTLALDEDGHVWSWGYNGYGQLGDGGNSNRAYAAKVKDSAGTGDLSNIVRIAAGGDGLQGASLALAADGTIYVWGRNHQGQLGNGETSAYATKLPVAHAQNHVAEGAPSLSLSHTVTGVHEDGSISVTATPAHSGAGGLANIDRVEIHLNGRLSATFTGGVWSGSIGNLEAGSYHGYGVVFDDDGLMAMSAPFTFEITLDPADDKDGDGLTNGQEAALGTDPRDPDTDNDGMEDGYEQWHTFSPLVIEVGSKGPNGDFDQDGMSNLNEHNIGRTAKVKSEAFLIDPVNPGPDGMVARWFGRTTFWYTIEYSEDLANWTTYPMGFMGQNAELSVDVEAWFGAPLPPRLFVRLNWGPADTEDIDGDGLSASEEFALGSDPTKADTNGDGLPDGWAVAHGVSPLESIAGTSFPGYDITYLEAFLGGVQAFQGASPGDLDGDGLENSEDADSGNNAVDWLRTGEPRFAWFQVPPPASPWGGEPQLPVQVTDGGHVVFPAGIWSAGSYSNIALSGERVSNCRIIGMNAGFGGKIVGTGHYDRNDDGHEELGCMVWWSGGTPQPVRSGDYYASYPFSDYPTNGSYVGRDLGFVGRIFHEGTISPGLARWTLPLLGGMDASFAEVPEWVKSGVNGGFLWGVNQSSIGGMVTTMPGTYDRLVVTPANSVVAFSSSGSRPALHRNGSWAIEESFEELVDFSNAGFGVSREPVMIWSNGKTTPLANAVPELPEDWQTKSRLVDLSDAGNLLVSRQNSPSESADAYGLGVPIILEDDEEATGVDVTSVSSFSPGPGIDNKLWLMAPASGTNLVRFKSTASIGSCELGMVASPATFDPGSLTSGDQLVSVGAGMGSNSEDTNLRFSIATSQPLSFPVGIKVMKRRTIKVKVWIVPKKYGTSESSFHDPVDLPENQELGSFLTEIFGRQINASIECDVTRVDPVKFESHKGPDFGGPVDVDWQSGYGMLDFHGNFQGEVDDVSTRFDPTKNINVYLVGGVSGGQDVGWEGGLVNKYITGEPLLGRADVTGRRCWVIGGSSDGSTPGITENVIRDTMAHEIGHVIVGSGHPDEEGGVSPLPGTDRTRRLMCSGVNRKHDGTSRLLVKREWDAAESWLKTIVDTPQP